MFRSRGRGRVRGRVVDPAQDICEECRTERPGIRQVRRDRHHRAFGPRQNAFRNGSEHQPLEPAPAVCANDDQVGGERRRDVQDLTDRIPLDDARFDAEGVNLTLRAIGGNQAEDKRITRLNWRA